MEEKHIDMWDDRSGKMKPYSPAKAERGKKFKEIIAFAEVKKDIKTIEHLNSLPAVVSDVKYYEDSLKEPEETSEKPVQAKTKSTKRK